MSDPLGVASPQAHEASSPQERGNLFPRTDIPDIREDTSRVGEASEAFLYRESDDRESNEIKRGIEPPTSQREPTATRLGQIDDISCEKDATETGYFADREINGAVAEGCPDLDPEGLPEDLEAQQFREKEEKRDQFLLSLFYNRHLFSDKDFGRMLYLVLNCDLKNFTFQY
ncbi:hypothetical protein AK830_g2587 [Neonectria ditissima]|uniref:Uncharacterized protein n=1 Tax=Neonectria ditissima TaxID=78410 RepID=A0A0P7BJM1_9HYPO|nr:hypothetical protein AK830_g2587 [Neonectria ditissima]